MAEAAKKQLMSSLKKSLASGQYSDLKITCGPDSYNVHKVIVCERAEFFARAIKFGGRESNNSTIDLPKDEPAIIKLLIQYLYEGEYDHSLPNGKNYFSAKSDPKTPVKAGQKGLKSKQSIINMIPFPHTCSQDDQAQIFGQSWCVDHQCITYCCRKCGNFICPECHSHIKETARFHDPAEQLVTHTKMYEIADKYNVVGLKDLVIEKFSRACEQFWYDTYFAIAAHRAYSTTPDNDRGLRDIVCKTIAQNMGALIKKPSVEALLTEFKGLARDLLKLKIDEGWR
ncbi:hypothetical protein ACJBU6_05013 [Exserohilum turcicum]